jgi:hypothetical protein
VVRGRWFTPIILATQEAEMRTTVQNQPGKIVCETLSQKKKKKTHHKNGLLEWLKVKGPKFKPQYHKKKGMAGEDQITWKDRQS